MTEAKPRVILLAATHALDLQLRREKIFLDSEYVALLSELGTVKVDLMH